jgi:hypothetical protein
MTQEQTRSDAIAGDMRNGPSPQARRALEEAEERRRQAREAAARKLEIGGREGPEPTRYGDWEVKGIASDF